MKVAVAWSARRHYGESGLCCLRCDDLFKTAREFVRHPCWAPMQAEAHAFSIRERLKAARPQSAGLKTLTGEQMSFETLIRELNQ